MKEQYISLEQHHWYKVPKELSISRESCWQALSDYMEKNAKWRLIFLREPPQVISEIDYDTKKEVHMGFVRFSAGPKLEDSDTLKLPSIGAFR